MSRTLNKVMLIGNVGNEPEIKKTPSGIPVTSFRLATSESRKEKDGKIIDHTDWHTVIAWRGLAEIAEKFVKRGSRVFIEGKLQTRTYDDKQGNHRKIVEIIAETILLLDARKQRENEIDNEIGTVDMEHEANFEEISYPSYINDSETDDFYDDHFKSFTSFKNSSNDNKIPF